MVKFRDLCRGWGDSYRPGWVVCSHYGYGSRWYGNCSSFGHRDP